MAFTYADPQAFDRDKVRVLLNDVTETGHFWTDEEIAWAIAAKANVYYAAALLTTRAMTKFVSKGSRVKVGDLELSYSDAAEHFKTLRRQLRAEGAVAGAAKPYAGGISVADKKAHVADTDWDRPDVSVGMHDITASSTGTGSEYG